MAGYNRVVLMGNLTRDPEYRQLQSGQAVCRLGLATNRQFRNKQSGTMVQEVCYIDIDVWGAQADSCHQYLQKGRSVLVEGRLKFDSWEDPNGNSRSKHSIVADRVVFLSSQANDTVVGTTQDAVSSGSNFSNGFAEKPAQSTTSNLQLDPNNKVEKELLDQLEQAQNKVQAAQSADKSATDKGTKKKSKAADSVGDADQQKSAAGGEIDFKDTPPFEDELPF